MHIVWVQQIANLHYCHAIPTVLISATSWHSCCEQTWGVSRLLLCGDAAAKGCLHDMGWC